jgi:hypothetical protein
MAKKVKTTPGKIKDMQLWQPPKTKNRKKK